MATINYTPGQYKEGIKQFDNSNVITPDSVKPIAPINIQNTIQPPIDTGAGMVTGAATGAKQFDTDYQRYLDLNQKTESGTLDSLIKDLGISPSEGRGQEQLQAEQQIGVPQFSKELADVNSQIKQQSAAYEKQIRDIEAGAGRLGLTTSAVTGQQGAVARAAAADIGLLQAKALGLQGQLQAAQETVNRAIDLKYADKEAEYKTKLQQYNLIKDQLTGEEKRRGDALAYALKKEETALADEKQKQKDIQTLAIEASKNGFKGDISGAKTVNEVLQKISGFLMSPKEKLEVEKLKGDIAKNTLELLQAKKIIGGTTGSPVGDIIAGSSKYGDKRLTDSQLEKIQKATSALGSMETLQGLLSQGKDGINISGPVTGRLRALATQLGGDANASAINATIQGLIPTVARGIFGEVGVLTDADIENYRKTVPNLKGSGEQNKLISLVMYDVLSRSLENTLVSNAQNQANVSGFLNTYQDTKKRIDTLKSNLGVVETVPITPVNKAKLENAWTTQLSPQNVKNSLDALIQ